MIGLAFSSFGQENFEQFYKQSKEKGHLDLKPEVEIMRVGLSQFGETYADSLTAIYGRATATIPQMTKDGFLSNGVGRYFTKKELLKKIDVYEIEEYFRYRDSKNYDYSAFFVNIDQHIAEADLRMKESLFFEINEDCRAPKGYKKFGNLECWSEKIDNYMDKKVILIDMQDELVRKVTAGN